LCRSGRQRRRPRTDWIGQWGPEPCGPCAVPKVQDGRDEAWQDSGAVRGRRQSVKAAQDAAGLGMSGNLHWFARVEVVPSIGMVQVLDSGIASHSQRRLRPKGHQADMDEKGQGRNEGGCLPDPDRRFPRLSHGPATWVRSQWDQWRPRPHGTHWMRKRPGPAAGREPGWRRK